ncbi:hypothetical protein [Amycolatopsis sp. NPDC051372]|uniref:hypothetical protein n=1 Tax=Amycolatopsis sp. NPDC051372 TaxID=3155669 RepID=UPI00341F0B16
MTWWAALLGFLGAVAGSWGGQIIASRRQRKTEDARWDRERLADKIDKDHQFAKLLYDRKEAFYLDLLPYLYEWAAEIDPMLDYWGNDRAEPPENIDSIKKFPVEVGRYQVRCYLHTEGKVEDKITDVLTDFIQTSGDLDNRQLVRQRFTLYDGPEGVRRKLYDGIADVIDLAQKDLRRGALINENQEYGHDGYVA